MRTLPVRSRRPRLVLVAAVAGTALVGALSGCGSEAPDTQTVDPVVPTYDSPLEAPPQSAYSGSDESPGRGDGRVDLDLDSGAQVVLWIDPDDIRQVYEQHSDPEGAAEDERAWTEPHLLYTAGDGCLFVDADTDGTLVAATLGCYETDAFLQQAPDQGQAVATTDLATWDVQDGGELFDPPEIAEGGGTVSWGDLTWTPSGGFS